MNSLLPVLLSLEAQVGRESFLHDVYDYIAHVEADTRADRAKKRVTFQEPEGETPQRIIAKEPNVLSHHNAVELKKSAAKMLPPMQACSYCGRVNVRRLMREASRTVILNGRVMADRYYCTLPCEEYREALLFDRMRKEAETRRLTQQARFENKWYQQVGRTP
jgi:hypothetical protein